MLLLKSQGTEHYQFPPQCTWYLLLSKILIIMSTMSPEYISPIFSNHIFDITIPTPSINQIANVIYTLTIEIEWWKKVVKKHRGKKENYLSSKWKNTEHVRIYFYQNFTSNKIMAVAFPPTAVTDHQLYHFLFTIPVTPPPPPPSLTLHLGIHSLRYPFLCKIFLAFFPITCNSFSEKT